MSDYSKIRHVKILNELAKNHVNYIRKVHQHPLTPNLYKENLFNYGKSVKKYDPVMANEWKLISSLLKPLVPSTAIDIGTKLGEWARIMEPNFDLIYCFEPNLENIKLISQNCILNKLRIYNCCSGSSFGNTTYTNPKQKKEYKSVTLPIDYIHPINVNLIRISAGGRELDVVKGATNTILKYKPIVIIQFNTEALQYLFDLGMQPVTKMKNYYILNWDININTKKYICFNNDDLTDLYNSCNDSDIESNHPFEYIILDDQ